MSSDNSGFWGRTCARLQQKNDQLQAQLKEAEFVIRSLYNVDTMQIDRDEYDYRLESQEVVRLTGEYLAKYGGDSGK